MQSTILKLYTIILGLSLHCDKQLIKHGSSEFKVAAPVHGARLLRQFLLHAVMLLDFPVGFCLEINFSFLGWRSGGASGFFKGLGLDFSDIASDRRSLSSCCIGCCSLIHKERQAV